MNWLDNTIAWFAPQAALKRARARAALDVVLAYEGAKAGRRTSGWFTSGTSANAEIGPNLATLRDRSRDLERNNPYAARIINELVGQAIGTGITAQARSQSDALNQQIDDAWAVWMDECDADGQLDFNGIQDLVLRTMLRDGECLVRYRPRRSEDGFRVPLQLQVIEPDFLDTNKTEKTERYQIIQGVEFDLVGRRQAYWMFSEHPGDTNIGSLSNTVSRRIPADQILHVYRKQRPGQVRGVPILHPVILAMNDLGEYQDAERVRKKIEACLAMFVASPEGQDAIPVGSTTTDDAGNRIESFRPGMVMYGRPGEQASFFAPTGAGGYSEYVRQNERMLATGVNLTYEQLTGDLSTVNYSSYRAGLLSFRTGIESLRWLCLIPGFLRPVRNKFIEAAFVANEIRQVAYETDWTPPAFGSVDPLKDAEAVQLDLQTGRMTWPQAVAEYGFDPRKQIEEIKRWKSDLEEAGVTFSSKAVSDAKQSQNNQPPA